MVSLSGVPRGLQGLSLLGGFYGGCGVCPFWGVLWGLWGLSLLGVPHGLQGLSSHSGAVGSFPARDPPGWGCGVP